ncbi:MAG TPA: hypothetical protein VGD94_05285 [Vicinamibacterales bacterium]
MPSLVVLALLSIGTLLVLVLRRDKLWSAFGLLLAIMGFLLQLREPESAVTLRYAAAVLVLGCAIVVAYGVPRATWRESRLELVLTAALIGTIASAVVLHGLSMRMFDYSLVVTGVVAVLLTGLMVRRACAVKGS